jgi:hypothetical protein
VIRPGLFPGATRINPRDRSGMTTRDLSVIDIGRALDLLAAAVKERGEYFVYPPFTESVRPCLYSVRGGPRCLVGHALSLAHVGDDDLDALEDRGVRELYGQGKLPVRLTIGALVVLDAAQRMQDRGYAWGDALDYAGDVAVEFLDLVPDSVFEARSPSAASDWDSPLSA